MKFLVVPNYYDDLTEIELPIRIKRDMRVIKVRFFSKLSSIKILLFFNMIQNEKLKIQLIMEKIRNRNFGVGFSDMVEKYSDEMRKALIDWKTFEHVTVIKFNPKQRSTKK